MKSTTLEHRLLSVYRQALRQDQWTVADHLLSAIEACAPPDVPINDTVAEAYRSLAKTAVMPREAQATRSRPRA